MHPLLVSLLCITPFLAASSIPLYEEGDAFEEVYADSLKAARPLPEPVIPDEELVEFEEVQLSMPVIEAPDEGLISYNPHMQETDAEMSEDFFEEQIYLQGESTEIPTGSSSFTDDVDLDDPTPTYIPPPPPPPPNEQSLLTQELTIDLKNPVFSQGVITTDEGGVISGQGLRIQAMHIDYTNKIENGVRVQKIFAEGDLLLEYAGRAFVGSKLEYDFITKTGTLWDGKTFIDIWFLGGDKIELKEDGTFYVFNAYVTTCEEQDNAWEIAAKRVKITKERLMSANNIRFQFFKVPLFWLPSFKSNLKAFTDAPIRYKVVWDKGLGPRLTMRYRVFSWNDLNLFFRLDYRLKRGFGGALESEYFSKDKLTTFVTRSYGAHDKIFPDEKGPHRYRLQGLYHTQTQDEKTQFHLTWDKLSDSRMVGDFRSDDFVINTQKRTHMIFYHQMQDAFVNFTVQPRINSFQSIDQELPLFTSGIRPFELGNSGILFNNYFSAGYLDYVYANDLRNEFHELGLKSSTKAARLQTINTLYRPFQISHFTLTPSIGVSGIFYSNNPAHHPIGQGVFTYGFKGETLFYKNYGHFRHLSEPYLQFQGLTSPTAALSHHFYFDLADGYDQLNQLRLGWRNSFFNYKQSCFLPSIFTDLYTYGFFSNRAFAQTFPKAYFTAGWNRPSYNVKGNICWNNEEHVWDFTNVSTDITVNEDIAFGLEFRHRSRFDWRKADHFNFILDVARPISELLKSPLSDGRNTFLARLFVRLSPQWTCHVETRHGWGRKHEPSYNAGKIDLFTMISCSWRLRLSYERMPNDNRFSSSISLVK